MRHIWCICNTARTMQRDADECSKQSPVPFLVPKSELHPIIILSVRTGSRFPYNYEQQMYFYTWRPVLMDAEEQSYQNRMNKGWINKTSSQLKLEQACICLKKKHISTWSALKNISQASDFMYSTSGKHLILLRWNYLIQNPSSLLSTVAQNLRVFK